MLRVYKLEARPSASKRLRLAELGRCSEMVTATGLADTRHRAQLQTPTRSSFQTGRSGRHAACHIPSAVSLKLILFKSCVSFDFFPLIQLAVLLPASWDACSLIFQSFYLRNEFKVIHVPPSVALASFNNILYFSLSLSFWNSTVRLSFVFQLFRRVLFYEHGVSSIFLVEF